MSCRKTCSHVFQEGRLPVVIFGTTVLLGALAAMSLPETNHKPVPRDIGDTDTGN